MHTLCSVSIGIPFRISSWNKIRRAWAKNRFRRPSSCTRVAPPRGGGLVENVLPPSPAAGDSRFSRLLVLLVFGSRPLPTTAVYTAKLRCENAHTYAHVLCTVAWFVVFIPVECQLKKYARVIAYATRIARNGPKYYYLSLGGELNNHVDRRCVSLFSINRKRDSRSVRWDEVSPGPPI